MTCFSKFPGAFHSCSWFRWRFPCDGFPQWRVLCSQGHGCVGLCNVHCRTVRISVVSYCYAFYSTSLARLADSLITGMIVSPFRGDKLSWLRIDFILYTYFMVLLKVFKCKITTLKVVLAFDESFNTGK